MRKKIKQLTVIPVALMLFFVAGICTDNVYADSDIFVESNFTVESDSEYFTLDFRSGVEVVSVTSSDDQIVSINEVYWDFVGLYSQRVGTAVITATDANGKTDICEVTVKPDKLELDTTSISFSEYDEYNEYEIVYSSNVLKSVASSDQTVVKAALDSEEVIRITPVAAGTAQITVKDRYNQIAVIDVVITQKYIDEEKYLEDLKDAFGGMDFGDTEIIFAADFPEFKNASVVATIDGKQYIGKHVDSRIIAVENLPLLPVGTEIEYEISLGEAKYSSREVIPAGDLSEKAYLEFSNEDAIYEYTGKAITPKISVSYYINSGEDEMTLNKDIDYRLDWQNNVGVGRATVVVTGIGSFTNSASEHFKIVPKGTSLTKVTPKKKSFSVKWKKQVEKMPKTRISGYQVRYSTDAYMDEGVKTVKVKGYKKTSKKIKGLKAKKKYYVQVRTYKNVSGKPYYSKWSAKRSVRTK